MKSHFHFFRSFGGHEPNNHQTRQFFLLAVAGLLIAFLQLAGCGGGGSGGDGGGSDVGDDGGNEGGGDPVPDEGEDSNFAFLLDSPVGGVVYSGNGIDGTTSFDGRFRFRPGEPVSFSFAGMDLGTATINDAGTVVTPAELQGVARADFADDGATVNLLRLLQTLDLDGDPSNGILLPDQQALADAGLEDELSGIEPGDPSFDAQIAASLTELAQSLGTGEELVTAEQAIEHFESTLELIAIPDSIIVLEGSDEWQWDAYGGARGEWNSRIVFNEDGTGQLLEYGNCSDSGVSGWIGTYERARAVCSDDRATGIRWTIDGNTFEVDTGSFTDSCTIISGNINHFTASCRIFEGGGRYQTETQYFVRTGVDGFYSELLAGRHLEFGDSGTYTPLDWTVFNINRNGTGTYKVGDEPEESYDWTIGSNIADWILDVAGEGVLDPIKFRRYVAGAHEIGAEANSTNTVLIPGYRGWGSERYVLRYSLTDAGGGYLLSRGTDQSFSGNPARACLDTREVCLDKAETGEAFSKVCSSIHRIPTADRRGVYWMNCRPASSADAGEGQSFQLWRLE